MSFRMNVKIDGAQMDRLLKRTLSCEKKSRVVFAAIDLLQRIWEEMSQGYQVILRNDRATEPLVLPVPDEDQAVWKERLLRAVSTSLELRLSEARWRTIKEIRDAGIRLNQSDLVRLALDIYDKIVEETQKGATLQATKPGSGLPPRSLKVPALNMTEQQTTQRPRVAPGGDDLQQKGPVRIARETATVHNAGPDSVVSEPRQWAARENH